MKKLLYVFIIALSIHSKAAAQLSQGLYVNYRLNGANETAKWYYLTAPGTFSITSLATNFCASSKVKWTLSPSKGATINNPNIYEPTVSFNQPGTYVLTMTVTTYSAQGWTCQTATQYETKYISIPKKKK